MQDPVTHNAVRFLETLRRSDLSALLFHAEITVGTTGTSLVVVVRSPRPFSDALEVLPPHDRQRIAQAAVSNRPSARAPADIIVRHVGDVIDGHGALLPDLIIHRDMMISVATGGRTIQDVDDYYVARQVWISDACAAAGIAYENPHNGLWEWYNFWKAHFATYAERREYVRKLFAAPIAAASARIASPSPVSEREPTGWERVDRALGNAKTQLARASTEEEWQAVGLVCREVLISLAQAVFDPEVHQPTDGIAPSATDANRMTEAYLQHVFPGESYKEVRGHARAALALALNLQHRRTATRQLAALCLEGTSSAVAVISIIAGRTV
ncbi:hypothetical protein RPMA_02500 [Tardiphaga alba]|uniref:Uncharacterized protein n=1 Tax=Tardiphaga alba TaxID=340268 RepID=A0ABX8A3V8_9BRAD|nr:hypothetical protein [Tardiphaga alba]QUS37852.1 hypothetical protein RPMA_02500 [Tardiphaga alba]